MARTVADRLRDEAARSFVGRQAELGALSAGVTADPSPYVVAYVHGPGGVGKSRLLKALADGVSPAVQVSSLDCAQIEPTPRGFLQALAGALDEDQRDPELETVVDRLESLKQKTLLILDVYETFGLMDAWLRNTFFPSLPDTVTTVIAGRNAPSPAWLTTPGWEGLFRDVELRALDPDDAHDMLVRRGLTVNQAERVRGFAHGHPLALELAAAAIKAQPDMEITGGPPPKILGQLSAVFLAGLPPAIAEAAEAGATVRRITHPVLDALLDGHADQELLEGLRDLPFVEAKVEGLAFHDLVRDTISADLARRDPERHREYRRRAWRLLTSEAHSTAALNLWQHTADLLFLFQNPHVREAFFPAGSTEVSIEPAGPAESSAILEIVDETSPDEAPLMHRWLELQPDAFYVARDVSGEVVAFHMLVESGDVHPGVPEADPLTRAWLEHLANDPVAEHERVLFFRRWLTQGVGEGPSAAQAASWLDVKRTYMELRPNLRRLYAAASDLAGYVPTLGPLGFRPVPEANAEIEKAVLQTAVLDFGEASVDGWLRGLIGDELGADLGAEADGQSELPEGTVTILFTDIVDSTKLTEQLGDEGFRSLARRLDREVRAGISETGGVPVEGLLLGDGLMAVFTSAHQAIEGAIRAQSVAEEVGLGLHLGLHSGDVIREGNNVFGGAVNMAARVAGLAPPGEILVSETVRGLARTSASVGFAERGSHSLKGVKGAQDLYAVLPTVDRAAAPSLA